MQGELLGLEEERGADPLHLPVHLQGNQQRPDGVVLVSDRGAEEGQKRIARELVHIAAVPSHDLGQRPDDRIDHLEQLFGIETVRQRGEAREVGEQAGHQAAFFREPAARLDQPVGELRGDEAPQSRRDVLRLGRRPTFRAGRGAAIAAETRSLRVLAPALLALPDGHDVNRTAGPAS